MLRLVTAAGIVAAMLADLEGRHGLDRVGQAAVARQRRGDDALERAERRAGGDGIAGVRHHQQRGLVAAPHPALEARRDLDAEQDGARPQPMVHLRFRAGDLGDGEVGRVVERRQHRAAEVALLVHQHGGRHVARRGVDGVAEQQELHHGDEQHHGEGQPVAAQLHELLDEHGPRARRGGRPQQGLDADHWKLSCDWLIRLMNTSSSEGCADRPVQLGRIAEACHRLVEGLRIAAGHVQAGAERGHHVDAGHAQQLLGERLQVGAAHRVGAQVRLRDHLLDGALRQQLAVGDVGDLVAALGLVHVVGGDQHAHALGGELVDLAPELAPRLGVDAGGRLVEQQQLGLGQDAGAERQALLPAARQLAGQLALAALQAQPLDGGARLPGGVGEAVDAGDELQVLQDRQVLVEREALRHVADVVLDLLALGADVVAERRAAAAVGRQQPAQHAQGGGLAGAVGAEEAVDLAAAHAHRQVAHDHLAAEGLGQPLDLDGDVAASCRYLRAWLTLAAGCTATVTGWPTRKSFGRSGIASMRNTSRARSSWL